MGNTVICRLARRLALAGALVAVVFVFMISTASAGTLLAGSALSSGKSLCR